MITNIDRVALQIAMLSSDDISKLSDILTKVYPAKANSLEWNLNIAAIDEKMSEMA
jgi:hypothetical protein